MNVLGQCCVLMNHLTVFAVTVSYVTVFNLLVSAQN